MPISLKQIAKLKTKHPEHSEGINFILISTLSGLRMRIYNFLKHEECDSRTIATCFKVSIFHASTVLKQLYDLGLIRRRLKLDEFGQHYIWTEKKDV